MDTDLATNEVAEAIQALLASYDIPTEEERRDTDAERRDNYGVLLASMKSV